MSLRPRRRLINYFQGLIIILAISRVKPCAKSSRKSRNISLFLLFLVPESLGISILLYPGLLSLYFFYFGLRIYFNQSVKRLTPMDFENRRLKLPRNPLRRSSSFILSVPIYSLVSRRIPLRNILILSVAIYLGFLFQNIAENLFFKCFILRIEALGLILSFLISISTVLYSILYARNISSISSRAQESLSMRLYYALRVEHRVLRRFQESLSPQALRYSLQPTKDISRISNLQPQALSKDKESILLASLSQELKIQ